MQFIKRTCAVISCLLVTTFALYAQDTTDIPTSVDPKLIEWQNNIYPTDYTIGSLTVTGLQYLDSSIVLSISGLQSGDNFIYPGADIFAKAIRNLWKQKLFSNIQVNATKISGNIIDIEITVTELPKIGSIKYHGVNKTVADELKTKMELNTQNIITEATRRKIIEVGKNYFADKGFKNATVKITEVVDKDYINSNVLNIYIVKGEKVKVEAVNFYGNEKVSEEKLKKQMKGVKEKLRLSLRPQSYVSSYGVKKKLSFKEYIKDLGFLKPTKTNQLLSPYMHLGFSNAKFNNKKYVEDKDKVLAYYNSLGYRDAQITADTIITQGNKIYVDLKVDEGRKYYFGDFAWKGNTKYNDSLLTAILSITKGQTYNIKTLRSKTEFTGQGGDIMELYQDDGYLFSHLEVIETAVYNDTINHELRITEGPQARIKDVTITGNVMTKDNVIRRELRTIPGEIYNRTEIVRSQRDLGALQFFNQESIKPGMNANPTEGTVDINWSVEEKSSSQLEMSAGWGGNIGLTGTLGIVINNFSAKNIWRKSAWDPLPIGDGQKLSLRFQSNGKAFSSYSFSFTEPWLGGKKRNSLTFGFNNSKYTNAYDPYTGYFDNKRADSTYLKINSYTVSYGKQLKWPDDYFNLVYSLSLTQYKMRNYPIFAGINSGKSTNLNFKVSLSRSSVYDPIFPRSGSSFLASVQLTPPYSAFNPKIATSANPYKLPEYHKWRFNAEWYVPIGKAKGEDKTRQLVLKLAAKYGFLGRYNNSLDFSPFERFQVGDAGLTNNFGVLGYDIIAHRGYPVYTSSNPTVNPDNGQNSSKYFTIFNKYQAELRYPLVTNPSSTIYGLAFLEAANGWYNFKDYNPFKLRRSVGLGVRFFLPMFGLLGFDYGLGLDRITSGTGLKEASKFTFMLGFEPE